MGRHYSKSAGYKKFFHLKDDLFLLHEYNRSSTINACPPKLTPYLVHQEPVVHTFFKGGSSKKGHITSYLLKGSIGDIGKTTIKSGKIPEVSKINRNISPEVDNTYNIFYRHINLEGLQTSIINAIRFDISRFCKEKEAKDNLEGDHFTLVDRINPNPKFTLINPGEGKGIIKYAKGKFYDICILDIGLDFSMGCISNVTPDGLYAPWGKCSYCYEWQNGPCTLDTLFDINEDWLTERLKDQIRERELDKRKKLFFRFGQGTETMIPQYIQEWEGFQNNLKIALRSLIRIKEELGIKISVAMPTKIPEFDEELAELFKGANVALLGSIGYSSLETGMVAHGFGVNERLEGLLEYRRKGVNANIYIATNIVNSLDEIQEDARIALAFSEKNEIPLQMLDIRATKKKDVELITEMSWEEALANPDQINLFRSSQGGWRLTGQSYLHAQKTNQDFLDIIENNKGDIRMCSTHVVKEEQKCGKCFMDK